MHYGCDKESWINGIFLLWLRCQEGWRFFCYWYGTILTLFIYPSLDYLFFIGYSLGGLLGYMDWVGMQKRGGGHLVILIVTLSSEFCSVCIESRDFGT